jgi:hypothetical protein
MAANTAPIFIRTPSVQWNTTGTAANTNLDGTGTVATVFTADATEGSKVERLRLKHLGSNIATVVRVFVNNGSTNGTASNNSLVLEYGTGANTLAQNTASAEIEIPVNIALPAGYKLNVAIGTAVATGIQVTAEGGHY